MPRKPERFEDAWNSLYSAEPTSSVVLNGAILDLSYLPGRQHAFMYVERQGDLFLTDEEANPPSLPGKQMNYQALRSAFELASTPQQIEAFLRVCGPFRDHSPVQEFEVKEFQDWQDTMKDLAIATPLPQHGPHPDALLWHRITVPTFQAARHSIAGRQRGSLSVEAMSLLELIGALAFIDLVNGVSVSRCKYKNCSRIFRSRSEHAREFCSSEHASSQAKYS